MENKNLPANSSPTISTKPSRQGPAHTKTLLQGSTADLVGRLNKAQPRKVVIPELQGQEAELMTGVFARMKSIYGHLWSSNWTDENQLAIAKLDWLTALRREHFTLADVNAALDYCANKVPDMPNLPRFVAIARLEQYRLQRQRENASGQLLLPESPEQALERKAQEGVERARYCAIAQDGLAGIKKIFSQQ